MTERAPLPLQVIQPGEGGPLGPETRGFREGTIGIYSPGALGVAMAHNLGIDQFITRAGSRLAGLFAEEADLNIHTDQGQTTLHGHFSHGLVGAYREGNLPEVVLVCPNADKVPDLVGEIVDLTYEMVTNGVLHLTSERKLRGLDRLPSIILASNGILDELMRERIEQTMRNIVADGQLGKDLASAWLGKVVRGLSYVSAERVGFGSSAVYRPPTSGVVTLSGGDETVRKRVVELTTGKAIRFLDRGDKESTVVQEWRKAYTNLMTNVVGLTLCFDERRGAPRLNIPVGRILQRMLPAQNATFIEVEGANDTCASLGKAFLALAHARSLFNEYSNWEEFHNEVFVKPLRRMGDLVGFYSHVPSVLQMVANDSRVGRLPDGLPPNEEQIISTLLATAANSPDQFRNEIQLLQAASRRIEGNIAAVKEIYRQPQVVDPVSGTIRRVFNQTGEVGYVAFNPPNIGMSPDQVKRYVTKSSDVDCGGEMAVPMTAEVFAYGPEKIPGNVAFITNGAGFTLEVMDRCVEAGVRLGFVSDLRLQFEEGKYYLAMKMALAANPAIDTIAIDVLTTLGTSADVARAVERIAGEHPGLRFVVKVEGREQREGMEILQRLKQQGLEILYTQSDENLPADQLQPLTLDQMVRELRNLDGMPVDQLYEEIYGELREAHLSEMLRSALEQRYRNLLIPQPIISDNQQELEVLQLHNMFHPDAIFGQEFRPARANEALTGKPIVVIAGYGDTPRLQARLMRQAGTEVVLLHPQMNEKVKPADLETLHALGIRTYTDAEQLQADLVGAYPEGVDLVGVCYEPYKPEVENGDVYSERVERAVDALIELKMTHGLSVRSILIPTEMVPTVGAKNILAKCKHASIWFIGPNSPGASRVNREAYAGYDGAHLKIAQIPRQCVSVGDIAVAGVGGTMLFETLAELKRAGRGITSAISLGGDRTRGLSARDAALVSENDPETRFIVYIGEPGGNAAQELAEIMQAGLITKPVIVKIIGHRQPDQCYIGHAGAVTHGGDFERADVKIDELRQAGAIIVNTPEQMAQVVKYMETYSRFGQIDVESIEFQTAKTVMGNLASAQNAVIGGLLPKN